MSTLILIITVIMSMLNFNGGIIFITTLYFRILFDKNKLYFVNFLYLLLLMIIIIIVILIVIILNLMKLILMKMKILMILILKNYRYNESIRFTTTKKYCGSVDKSILVVVTNSQV